MHSQKGHSILGKRQRSQTDEYNLFSDDIDTSELSLEKNNSVPIDVLYETTRKCQRLSENENDFVYTTKNQYAYQPKETMNDRTNPSLADAVTEESVHNAPISFGKVKPVTEPIFKMEKILKRKKNDNENCDLYLRMNSSTWMRDMFDLYDFDSNYHLKNKCAIKANEVDICLKNEEVTMNEK